MDKKQWRRLNFSVPIEQSADEGKDFLIKGTAINSTLTRNGVEFVSEELKVSAASLRNKPILKDHTNSIDSIVGRTTQNVGFNSVKENVEFEAKIMDKEVKEKIKDGRIQSVSVGAMVSDIEEATNDDGEVTHVIARGIDFVELSLVAVPADPNAGLAQAIKMSFNLKNETEKVSKSKTDKMAKETKQEDKEETKVELSMSSELTDALTSITESLKVTNERLDKIESQPVEKETKIEEKIQSKELVDETKGEVVKTDVEQSTDEYEGFNLERGNGGFSLNMNSYPSKFKKLNRGEY